MEPNEKNLVGTTITKNKQQSTTDTGWAWIVMIATIMTAFLIVGFLKSYGLFIVEFVRVYDCSASMASLIQGVLYAANGISGILTLTVGVEVWNSRRLVILSSLIFCMAYIVASFASVIEVHIVANGVLLGVAMGISYGPSIVICGRYFSKWRGLATGLIMSGASLGGLVLPFLVHYLLEEYGLHGTFLICGGLMLNLMVFGALMRPLPLQTNTKMIINEHVDNNSKSNDKHKCLKKSSLTSRIQSSDTDSSTYNLKPLFCSKLKVIDTNVSKIGSSSTSNKMFQSLSNLNVNMYSSTGDIAWVPIHQCEDKIAEKADVKRKHVINRLRKKCWTISIIENKLILLLGVCTLLVAPGCYLVGVYIPPHAETLGMDKDELSLLASVIGGADLTGRVICSLIADTKWLKKTNIIVISTVIAGMSAIFASFYKDYWSLIIFSCAYGLFGGVYFVLFAVVLIDFVGTDNFPCGLALITALQGISIAASMPILGLICDVTGSYLSTFYILGSCLVIGGCVLLLEPLARRAEEYKTHIAETNAEMEKLDVKDYC